MSQTSRQTRALHTGISSLESLTAGWHKVEDNNGAPRVVLSGRDPPKAETFHRRGGQCFNSLYSLRRRIATLNAAESPKFRQ